MTLFCNLVIERRWYVLKVYFWHSFLLDVWLLFFSLTVMMSLCSMHPLDYLWRMSPFGNRLWCLIAPMT